MEDVPGVPRTSLQGGLRFRPPGPMAVSLEGRVSREADDRQFVATGELPDSVYRLFGHVDRREGSLTFRVDLALTPRMSVELYAQPFVSAGRYSAVRLVADPQAPDASAVRNKIAELKVSMAQARRAPRPRTLPPSETKSSSRESPKRKSGAAGMLGSP